MVISSSAGIRKSHFLGSKLRELRKRSGMTLEDLAYRCFQLDSRTAPSISYLSLIENGRRSPSQEVLELLAGLFQKESTWFLDDSEPLRGKTKVPNTLLADRLTLEPRVLFSKDMMEISIPEMLTQSGISGRQFAHSLIRSYQELNKNHFPDLEKIADEISGKKFPLSLDNLLKICSDNGLKIKWFERPAFNTRHDAGHQIRTLFRSFFEAPDTVYINRQLENEPARLKYELAYRMAHKILHGGDGVVSIHATGGELGGSPRPSNVHIRRVNQEDILLAWRDFECSFFAGAVLCPRQPFRRFLLRTGYSVQSGQRVELTPSVIMRRMTAVSPYPNWHYLDVYPPGILRAMYRGNGIPMPWGSMMSGTDLCQNWALFRMATNTRRKKPLTQISLLVHDEDVRLYSCVAIRTRDAAGNTHVVSVGIDLIPLLETQDLDWGKVMDEIRVNSIKNGEASLTDFSKNTIKTAANALNLSWVAEGVENPAVMICARSSNCPRDKICSFATRHEGQQVSWVDEIKQEILEES